MRELVRYKYVIDPGYIAVSDEPTYLYSICGGGVVITLWDKIKKIGGMAHCVLGRRKWSEPPTNYHADIAIDVLIKQIMDYQSHPSCIEAQLFGGGSNRIYPKKKTKDIVTAAKKVLKKYNIGISSEDTGGSVGRKIIFDTYSGDVMVVKTARIKKSDWSPELAMR